jgi:hypothetical protein
LADDAPLKKWACLDSATGEALAAAVRKHHFPDFLWRRCVSAGFCRLPPIVGHRLTLQNPAVFGRDFTRLDKFRVPAWAMETERDAHFAGFFHIVAGFSHKPLWRNDFSMR